MRCKTDTHSFQTDLQLISSGKLIKCMYAMYIYIIIFVHMQAKKGHNCKSAFHIIQSMHVHQLIGPYAIANKLFIILLNQNYLLAEV